MEAEPATAVPAPPGIEGLEPVGHGGSATVYRGLQPAFGRPVAVKVMWGAAGDLRHVAREARALGALSGHPNVVPVYEAGTLDGAAYLVMPYLPGGSLEDRVRRGPLDAGEVVRVGRAVAGALAAAHGRGILHRDVKPANVLFGAYGEVQLADFGIARLEDTTTQAGLIAATIAYAAPEVLSGEPASPASDVYSLAATLHAALAGAAPYAGRPGEAPIALAYRVVHDPPAPLDPARVPPALAAVVARGMARHPGDRPADAGVLAAELAASDLTLPAPGLHPPAPAPHPPTPLPAAGPLGTATAGPRTGGVPRPQPLPPTRRRRRRRGAVLTLAAVAAALVAAVVALVATGSPHPAPHRAAASAAPTTTATTTPTPSSAPGTTAAPATAAPPATAPAASAPPSSGPPPGAPAGGMPSAASVTSTLQRYYALVDAHQLQTSFTWLTPAYRARIGYAYYQSFWGGISRVDVESITPGQDRAAMVLRYVEASGATSTESVQVTLVADPASSHLLIDTYTAG